MGRAWAVTVVLAGCGFDGNPATDDGPGGVADAPFDAGRTGPDAPPGTPDAPPDPPLPDAPLPPDAMMCPDTYAAVPNAPTLYRYVGTGNDWLDAEQDCEDDGGGSHLVVFDTSGERDAIRAAFDDNVWIGFSDRELETVWQAVNGQTTIYTTGLGGFDLLANCARLKDSNGNLEERGCLGLEAYVCECDGAPGSSIYY